MLLCEYMYIDVTYERIAQGSIESSQIGCLLRLCHPHTLRHTLAQ
jgi:hypothetical protein